MTGPEPDVRKDPAQELSFLFKWRKSVAAAGPGLSSKAHLVALTLSLHMNRDGGSCFPGVDLLAKECNLNRKTISRAVSELERSGYIHCRRPSPGQRRAGRNTYYFARLPQMKREVSG